MRNKKQAFTIIEVVLVLAIAGLIFLMVFVALPALQKSQRNTRRKQDLTRVASAVIDYQSTNGHIPFQKESSELFIDEEFVPHYIDSSCQNIQHFTTTTGSNALGRGYESCSKEFTDPSGMPYILMYSEDLQAFSDTIGEPISITQTEFDLASFTIFTHASCGHEENNSYAVLRTEGPNDFAIITKLEGGAYFCQDNQ